MLILKLNKETIEYPNRWGELTLKQCIDVVDGGVPLLETYLDAYDNFEFVKKATVILSNLTEIQMKLIHPESLVYHYWFYLHPFVKDLASGNPETATVEYLGDFTLNGKTYLMPESWEYGSETILQAEQDSKSFCEAGDLMVQISKLKTAGIKQLPLFLSAMVKDAKGEDWSEKRVVERAKELEQTPMDIVWSVFFFTLKRYSNLQIKSLFSLPKVERSKGVLWIGFIQLLKAKWQALLTLLKK